MKKNKNDPSKCLCRDLAASHPENNGPFLVCADYPGCQEAPGPFEEIPKDGRRKIMPYPGK